MDIQERHGGLGEARLHELSNANRRALLTRMGGTLSPRCRLREFRVSVVNLYL
jgi:hypothetical protein